MPSRGVSAPAERPTSGRADTEARRLVGDSTRRVTPARRPWRIRASINLQRRSGMAERVTIKPYTGPAGGWGSARSLTEILLRE